MRRGFKWKIIPALICIIAVLVAEPEVAEAGTWNNALSYYNTYGNAAVFKSTSSTDGNIYYATKASVATTNTRYRTIGWKMTVTDLSGTKLQTIYYKLGGSYMTKIDTRSSSGYEYNMYSLSLYNLKRRLNSKATAAMEDGDMDITLDACMVVVKNNRAQGAMTDSGPSSGTVYTTYSGISGAASWSSSAKSSLKNYFGKEVDGLFVRVYASYDSGITGIRGQGIYCYGTYLTLTALMKKGYDFDQWSGSVSSAQKEVSFYASSSGSVKASSVKKKVEVIFHRNLWSGDTTYETVTFTYGDGGKSFSKINWTKNGQAISGWALTADSTTVSYANGYTVTDNFIISKSPRLDLYAVYPQQTIVNTPSTPTPSTPTPSTPTPSTPTPSTPTPDTQPPDTQIPDTTEPDTQEPDTEDESVIKIRKIKVRFISSRYFEDESQNLIPASGGGLAADSKWAKDASLRALLRSVLNRGE